ncbi:MFS transporter [Paenibacillus sp. N3/727]|uniref:phosphoglycerate transporter PgtP n=1 Tax=Paenibacillus sp. N3/727 TaxID=2925845 RepID=UPI001F536A50|nr:MFS transporter [Paenibacillus sp. N3/727]UNK18796.1 MFS transporter [Paenibacillus sp. N3/727]
MISFLKPKVATSKVAPQDVQKTYMRYRMQSLIGVFFGYMAYYVVRSNFSLSTPYLKEALNLSSTEVGLLTSCMLIAYGISKGLMSSLADKADPKKYMALGLLLCALVNIMLGFTTGFWMFAILVVLLGVFQGMGVGPSFITLSNWFPHKMKGRIVAVWNISHNIGAGIVAPIVGVGFAMLGPDHWQAASYQVPAAIAIVFALVILAFTKGSPVSEGLPPLSEIVEDEKEINIKAKGNVQAPENLNAWQIFKNYVLFNKNAWYVSLMDVFVYMVRFGIISWLPIYLMTVKGFSKEEMGVAFLFFEWAAIPSTLLVGYLSDKLFKGYRMPPAIIAMVLIFFCIIGYWQSGSLFTTTIFAATIGCLIYVPQFLASVQTLEVVPPFAVGSAVGLRGFLSYILGASLGTTLFGVLVDNVGWNGGFYLLLSASVLCVVFCVLLHKGVKEMEKYNDEQEQLAT